MGILFRSNAGVIREHGTALVTPVVRNERLTCLATFVPAGIGVTGFSMLARMDFRTPNQIGPLGISDAGHEMVVSEGEGTTRSAPGEQRF